MTLHATVKGYESGTNTKFGAKNCFKSHNLGSKVFEYDYLSLASFFLETSTQYKKLTPNTLRFTY
jgi:hypothetical protein